jgi:ATP-binding cassette subfamily B protein
MSNTNSSPPDHLGLIVQARSQRRSWTRFRGLVRRSVGLTWQADPKLFIITTAIQLSGSLVLAGQVIAIRVLLDAILGLSDGSATVGSVVVPIVVLAALNALVAVSTAVQGNLQRLLGELVGRTTWHRILDVIGTVGLRAFESPAF